MAVFFLPQTRVEHPEEEEARESEYLPEAESPLGEPAPLPRPAAVEAVSPPEELRGAETPQRQSGGLLTHLQVPSRNTIAAVADKLAVWLPFPFVLVFPPYQITFPAPEPP